MELAMNDLKEYDLTTEAWKEYDMPGRDQSYRIDKPQKLFLRPRGTTHRVVDVDNVVHCVPIPGKHGCVLRWKNIDPKTSVNF